MREPTDQEKWRVAYHEAGHAVFFYLVRRPLRQVTIIPAGDNLGSASPTDAAAIHAAYNDGLLRRKDVESLIMILLAGALAEAKFLRRPRAKLPLAGSEQDWDIALRLASDQCGSNDEARAYLSWLVCSTRNLLSLDWHWEKVDVVAQKLLERGTLSGRFVKRLCKPLGPCLRE